MLPLPNYYVVPIQEGQCGELGIAVAEEGVATKEASADVSVSTQPSPYITLPPPALIVALSLKGNLIRPKHNPGHPPLALFFTNGASQLARTLTLMFTVPATNQGNLTLAQPSLPNNI